MPLPHAALPVKRIAARARLESKSRSFANTTQRTRFNRFASQTRDIDLKQYF